MIDHKQKTFHFYLMLFLLLVVTSVQKTYAQCPTLNVGDEIQNFCDADSPTVADLLANPDPTDGLSWYDAATGGNEFFSTESLATGSYWAGNTAGTCTTRLEVVVTVSGAPVNVAFGISRCASQENTIAQLAVPGTNIEWYDALTGGNLLPSTTALVDGVTYYVQQTENGCTSLRSSTEVTIVDPDAPIGNDKTFCVIPGDPEPTVQDLLDDGVAIGQNIIWYASELSNTALPTSTELVDGQSYFATQTVPARGCESSERLEIIVTVNIQPSSGTDGDVTICDNSVANIDLFDELEDFPDAGGTWTGPEATTNGDRGTLDTALLNTGSFVFTYTTATLNECSAEASTVTVTVQEEPDAGENVIAIYEICTNEAAVDLQSLLGGTPDAGGTWSPSLTSGTGLFDPAQDGSTTNSIVYTYTVTATSPCVGSDTATIEIAVTQAPNAGLDTSLNICDTDAPVDLFDSLTGADTGGTWLPALTNANGHRGTFNPADDMPGAYTYTLAPSTTCPEDESIVTVAIIATPSAGITTSINLCTNANALDLFDQLGSTADQGGTWSGPNATAVALTNGFQGTFDPAVNAAGEYTYTVAATSPCTIDDEAKVTVTFEQAPNPGTPTTTTATPFELCTSDAAINLVSLLTNPDGGGTWSPGATDGTFNPTNDPSGDYTYTIAATVTCPAVESIVSISVIAAPVAGIGGNITICTNGIAQDLFDSITGTPDENGTWSGPSASTVALTNGFQGTFDPAVHVAGEYTYTVAATSPCTVNDEAKVTVTFEQAPNPGTPTTTTATPLELCTSDAAISLFDLLTGEDAGGTWTPTTTVAGQFNPAIDAAGDYTYTIAATTACAAVESTVSINVSTQPFAGNDITIELCTNDTVANLFDELGGTPDAGGTWSTSLPSGMFDPTTETPGTATFRYTVPAIGNCPEDFADITVILNILPNAGTNAEITVCGDTTAFDLFPLLGTAANTGGTWLPALTGGIFDPASNASGVYVYTSAGTGACEDISATVTVTIINPTPTLPTDGEIFCIADSPLVSDLVARILPEMAGTIQVYATETDTTPIAETTAIINGDTYYISETDVTTSCEGTNRLAVTIQINDPEIPQLSNASAEFCLIDAPTIADLNSFIAQGANVVWVDAITNGNQFSETDALVSGDYYAIEEDINTCRSGTSTVISIVVNDNAPPALNPNGNELCGVDRPTIAELEANLTTDPNSTVVWYDMEQGGNTLNLTDLLIDNTTYYAATFNAITGCESNSRLEIILDLTACDLTVYKLLLPDGFSPNGDNINDEYDLRDVEFLYEDYTIEIYNRYGNLLFTGNNSVAPWDGTSNQPATSGDNIVPNGVYFYVFNFNRNNVSPQQGRIYLNR